MSTDARIRLLHLQDQNDAVGEAMKQEAARFDRIREAEPTRAVSAFNLFQTPEPIASRMAGIASSHDGPWLEPSAGLGRLYRAGRDVYGGPVSLVESSPECARELYEATARDRDARIYQRDFLSCSVEELGGPFGVVLMNPPFKRGLDIKHIRHAYEMLAPGGLLVSLCYDGVMQNRHLKPCVSSWEQLPPGAFKSEGTSASVALLTWEKH